MRLRAVAALVLLPLLAGCGSGSSGRATLWITRDRGAHVLAVRKVPAGLTAMQALERVAKVKTRYAGRYVQGIDGTEGSLSQQRDWFYFVNGYESDRSAAEYRLNAGDVEWWDYRSWKERLQEPVVVGAFPEPFLHGWTGHVRPAAVVYDDPSLAASARRLARVIHAATVASSRAKLFEDVNLLVLERGKTAAWAEFRGGSSPGDAIRLVVSGSAATRLARDPGLLRYRYSTLR